MALALRHGWQGSCVGRRGGEGQAAAAGCPMAAHACGPDTPQCSLPAEQAHLTQPVAGRGWAVGPSTSLLSFQTDMPLGCLSATAQQRVAGGGRGGESGWGSQLAAAPCTWQSCGRAPFFPLSRTCEVGVGGEADRGVRHPREARVGGTILVAAGRPLGRAKRLQEAVDVRRRCCRTPELGRHVAGRGHAQHQGSERGDVVPLAQAGGGAEGSRVVGALQARAVASQAW